MAIARVNLSFDLTRELDKNAYDILSSKSYKTIFVINAILGYQKGENIINLESIKDALREVLYESNIDIKRTDRNCRDNNEDNQFLLPDDVFNVFEQL